MLKTQNRYDVPESVYRHLRTAFVMKTANELLDGLSRSSLEDYPWHPGDPFGTFVAWLWESDCREEIYPVLADLLAELRVHNADADPRVRLNQILKGLEFALPSDFPKRSYLDLVQGAWVKVQPYLSGDINP